MSILTWEGTYEYIFIVYVWVYICLRMDILISYYYSDYFIFSCVCQISKPVIIVMALVTVVNGKWYYSKAKKYFKNSELIISQ